MTYPTNKTQLLNFLNIGTKLNCTNCHSNLQGLRVVTSQRSKNVVMSKETGGTSTLNIFDDNEIKIIFCETYFRLQWSDGTQIADYNYID